MTRDQFRICIELGKDGWKSFTPPEDVGVAPEDLPVPGRILMIKSGVLVQIQGDGTIVNLADETYH